MSTITNFIQLNWNNWLEQKFVSNSDFKKQLDKFYSAVPEYYKPSFQEINKEIFRVAEIKNILFKPNTIMRPSKGDPFKGRLFTIKTLESVSEQPVNKGILFKAPLENITIQFYKGELRIYSV